MSFAQFLTDMIMFFIRLGFFHRGDGDDKNAMDILDSIQKTLDELFKK